MRAVVQRVSQASVTVDSREVGAIGTGLLILLGVGHQDEEATARRLAQRIAALRVFADAAGKMNLDVRQAGGAALVVSQFTLHADASRGHRPSFVAAGPPDVARGLCETFAGALRAHGITVASGEFGATMDVALVNDGPVTIVLSSGEPPWEADAG